MCHGPSSLVGINPKQMFRVGIRETNKEKMKRFVNGLRRDIQDQVELYEYSTLQNVFTLALRIETHLKRKNRARKSYSPNHYYSHSWKGKAKEKHDKFPSKSHQVPSSKNKLPSGHTHHSTSQRSSSIKCFKCLGYNHIALNCPTKRTMILKKSNDVESEHSSPHSLSKESSSSSKTKIFEKDPMLLRRMIGQDQSELEPTQRENIFQSRCKINKWVCSLIIDGGSSTNVASTRLVEKLSLETIPHAKPYKLAWISKEGEIDANKQVLINFSIGSYKDKVLCDVFTMEVTHILLGRPWQFDKQTLHDGHTNQYIL